MQVRQKLKELGVQVGERLRGLFHKPALEALARESGFVKRSTSQLKGAEFVQLLTTEMLEEPTVSYEGLCDRLHQLNPEVNLTPQALAQRLTSEGAESYLHAVLQRALAENLKPTEAALDSGLLAPFGRVLLQDSTQGQLHEKLADEFKGSGGSASAASVKIDLTYDVKRQVIHQLLISAGATSDQSRAPSLVEALQANDLVIRDLGYFKLTALTEIAKMYAYFLSRLLSSADVYLTPEAEEPLDLASYLNRHYSQCPVIELAVYVGKDERLPCRLIAYRLPQEVVSERRRKAREKAAKQGRMPSKAYLAWLAFGFYITNVPQELWTADVIGTIYRLRWQIELTFKHWKSLLALHVLRGTRPERIRCLIYGRLIAIVMLSRLCGIAAWYAEVQHQREISFHKVINWFKRHQRLSHAIGKGCLNTLFDQLADSILRLCKQNRKRLTTKQLIDREINYMDSFIDNDTSAQKA